MTEQAKQAAAELAAQWANDPRWEPRPDLQLCAPEVGALMGEARTTDDPFYRRVLASTGIEPPDAIDWEREERRIAQAGLTRHVARWMEIHRRLQRDEQLVGSGKTDAEMWSDAAHIRHRDLRVRQDHHR